MLDRTKVLDQEWGGIRKKGGLVWPGGHPLRRRLLLLQIRVFPYQQVP
jgi:hypothetical protein